MRWIITLFTKAASPAGSTRTTTIDRITCSAVLTLTEMKTLSAVSAVGTT